MLAEVNKTEEDLRKSGLVIGDMHIRPLTSPERAMTMAPHSVDGYVIPYYNLYGRSEPFYRVKLFDFDVKYKQPKDTQPYVYFPPDFLAKAKTSPYIILTEGEKKATLATKLGFPACALAGVDAWRSRSVVLPADSDLKQLKSKVTAKLPAHTEAIEDTSGLAVGVQDLIDFVIKHKKHLVICYDADLDIGIKTSVQRAAAVFGFELRFRGIPFDHIRQIILPPVNLEAGPLPKDKDPKLGLDDWLIQAGPERFQELIDRCLKKRSAFPRHPAIRDLINKRLQKPNPNRKDIQQLSIAILSDLDANGIRLSSQAEGNTYYFDFVTRKLLRTTFSEKANDAHDTLFGQFLYRRYGISGADKYLITWLSAQFTGEDPIEEVSPHRVIARVNTNDDAVIYQLSDSQYARVDAQGLEIFDNGENGILFESEQVEGLDSAKVLRYYEDLDKPGVLINQWSLTLSRCRLRDQNKQRSVTALLYHMSPYLYRWRGMQLPVELVLGESGSGKSTLCELRLAAITGDPRLRNTPTDLKDWHASISNSGGLHVTDNVQLADRSLRQRLSDEICRLITEQNPHIEQRKYYTNNDLVRIPIRAVFALTAIQQPFQNADLLQRSLTLNFDKSTSLEGGRGSIMYDSEWRSNELARLGGREGWIAYHLLVLHRFFKLVQVDWDPKYQAKHRLINFEQTMMLMGKVFGEDTSWIPGYLAGVIDESLADSDWTFEGLKAFAELRIKHYPHDKLFTAGDIVDFCSGQEDFESCEMLTNNRRLGRYMQTHKSLIASSLGIIDRGQRNNRQVYQVLPPK
jgi:hypothetical protein